MKTIHASRPTALAALGLCFVLSSCGGSDSSNDVRDRDGGADSGASSGGRAAGSGGRATGGSTGVGTGGKASGGTGGASSGGSPSSSDAGLDATTDSGTAVLDAARDAQDGDTEEASSDASADAAPIDPRCETIETDATLTAHLKITADNECEVFVNGTSVGTTDNWTVAVTIDVSLFLYPGKKNVIAITGTNTSSQSGDDRGIIGELTIDDDGGVSPLLVTNGSWKVSQDAQDAGTAWTELSFDDSDWIAATEIADNGAAPWGAVLGTSAAKWIWFAPIPVDTNDKPNLETTLARKTFYIGFDGRTPVSDPACP